jgi:hypothetical protein
MAGTGLGGGPSTSLECRALKDVLFVWLVQ